MRLQIWTDQLIWSLTWSPFSQQRARDYRHRSNCGLTHVFVKVISDDGRSEASTVPHPKTWLTSPCALHSASQQLGPGIKRLAERAHLPSETLCPMRPLYDIRHDGDYQNWWMNIDERPGPWVNQIIKSSLTKIYHKWQPFWRRTKWLWIIHSDSYCINVEVTLLNTLGQ